MVKRYDLYYDDMDQFNDGDYVTYDDYAELQAKADAMEAALRDMLHAVCGETGFVNCVRIDSGMSYPWPALDLAEDKARTDLIRAMIREAVEVDRNKGSIFAVWFTNLNYEDELVGLYSTEKLAQARVEKYGILDRRSMRIEKELLDQ